MAYPCPRLFRPLGGRIEAKPIKESQKNAWRAMPGGPAKETLQSDPY